MKKILLSIFIFILALSLFACSNKEDGFTKSDLEITIKDQTFKLDEDVKPLLSVLGDSYVVEEAPSCVYEGLDKTYIYDNIQILTYPTDGKDYIDEIVLIDNTFKTTKGIEIGNTVEDVINTYGDNYRDDGGLIVYSLDLNSLASPSLFFIYDNDKTIISINYYSASNIE